MKIFGKSAKVWLLSTQIMSQQLISGMMLLNPNWIACFEFVIFRKKKSYTQIKNNDNNENNS